jgi:hypothetical protein
VEDVCNKVVLVGVEGLKLKLKEKRIKELERKMRKRLMKEGVEEVEVIGEEEGEVEVYNAKIGVCRIKSEKEYEIGSRVRMAIYKVEENTKLAVID